MTARVDQSVTLWNMLKLIYLNMWVGRPKFVLVGFFFAACIPAMQIFFLCAEYGLSGKFTAVLMLIPFLFWFTVVPMAFYLVTYYSDRKKDLLDRQLHRVDTYMR